jgi:hypothetical protein
MQLFVAILQRDVGPLAGMYTDAQDKKRRDDSVVWRAKQQAIQILHRIFQRYYNIQYLQGHYKTLGEAFLTTFAIPILDIAFASL